MFAEIVLIQQFLLHSGKARGQGHSVEIHKSALLQYYGIVNGVERIGSPGKGAVAVYQHRRDLSWVQFSIPKGLNNDIPCLQLIASSNLFRRHFSGARNFTLEVITLGRSQGRDALSCLGKAGGPAAMGMDDAS